MKRIALVATLIPLVIFEFYLCTALLPVQWQRAINDRIANASPKSREVTPINDPLLSQEIEQVFDEHAGLRILRGVSTVALLAGNGWLKFFIWRLQRPTRG